MDGAKATPRIPVAASADCPSATSRATVVPGRRAVEASAPANRFSPEAGSMLGLALIIGGIALWLIFGRGFFWILDSIATGMANG